MLVPVAIASVCVVWLVFYRRSSEVSKRLPLPPSPPGLPVLGHVFQLPSDFLFRKLGEWQKQLGGLYCVSAAGQTIVVIGDPHIATDILDRMSLVSSGRPTIPMHKMMNRGMEFAMNSFNDRWRQHRHIAQENFNARTAAAHQSLLERGAAELVQSLASPFSQLHEVLINGSAKTIWRTLYGEPSSSYQERIKQLQKFMNESFAVSGPTGSWVNLFPALAYLPKAVNPWKWYADERYERLEVFGVGLLREGNQSGSDGPFVASCEKAKEKYPEMTDPDMGFIAMTLFNAGSETVAFTTHFFILAMLLHPDVLKEAQRNIDSVVGNRLPTFEDRAQLPYIDALIKETIRWRTPGPLSIPHLATKDIEYEGYLIPKDSYIIPNIYYMDHDPTRFPDPDVFLPSRFLDSSGQLKSSYPTDYHDGTIGFGYGRRMCPGREFALNELFINFAYLVWSFDFECARDEEGREILPDPDALEDTMVVAHPAPFPCVVKPRKDLQEVFLRLS